MKKLLIIILITVLAYILFFVLLPKSLYTGIAIVPKHLPDGSIEFDFKDQSYSQKKAQKILYHYILKSKNKNFFEILIETQHKPIPNNVYAYFIDLNNDGKKDIIGIEKDEEYHRFTVYILLKNKFGYSSKQSFLLNGYLKSLYVLNTQTDGYKYIRAYGIFETYGDDCILKYDSKTNYYELSSCK